MPDLWGQALVNAVIGAVAACLQGSGCMPAGIKAGASPSFVGESGFLLRFISKQLNYMGFLANLAKVYVFILFLRVGFLVL